MQNFVVLAVDEDAKEDEIFALKAYKELKFNEGDCPP
jgi:hypothetical protein